MIPTEVRSSPDRPTLAMNAIAEITQITRQLRRWETLLALFLTWLMVEDLVRKLSGNDIRIYFVKDAIFAALLVSLWLNPATRGTWRAATGKARWVLYALIAWAVVMAVPTALLDWRLAVVGLRLDFLYLPLVVVGFLMARDLTTLARAVLLISLLGAAASAVGIVQAILGPAFLAPGVPTPGLGHLVNIRSEIIYQPTGTFVDPGRFDAMAVIAVAMGLGAIFLNEGRLRLAAASGLVFSLTGVWVSGGRAGLLEAATMVAIAAILLLVRQGSATRAIALIAVGAVVLMAALGYLYPKMVTFYWSSLDPRSSTNEWAFRWHLYTANTLQGINLGGFFGQGTGQESLGKQYLYGGATHSIAGLYSVEGGYAAIAVELGIVGLLLWLAWTLTWARRQLASVWAQRGTVAASAGFVLFTWIVIYTFIQFATGLQYFQNYYANAYFWLLSGIVFGLNRAPGSTVSSLVEKQAEPAAFSPRLLVLAPDPWGVGGVQQVTRTLLTSLSELYGADRIGVLQLWDHGVEPTNCRLLYRGFPTSGNDPGRVSVAMRARYLLAVIQSARRWRDNLVLVAVHAHLAPVAWLAAGLTSRPYAVWCHGLEVWGAMGPVMRLAVRNAAVVFASNRFTASRVEELAGLAPDSVRVFPYGLPSGYAPLASSGSGSRTVLAVARLAPEDAYKGIDSLICAWPQVSAQVPEARLEIVGDGPDRPRLMKMAETLGLNGTIHFSGRLSDEELHQAYARATVFAMPGRHSLGPPAQGEGFGMVFVEAGAAGLPVVAGRSAGAVEAVGDGESGLLVEPNEPMEVAGAIVRLLKDPELARRLGQAGRERAEGRFSYLAFKDDVDLLIQAVARHAH